MKKILLLAVCAVMTLSVVSAQEKKKDSDKTTTKFIVENMNCDNCVAKIEKNIAFEKGVTALKCDLPTKTVEVTYRTDKNSDEQLVRAFEKIKYKAKPADAPHE